MLLPDYIKSPLNYTGGKYKLLNCIIPMFPRGMNRFVDLFAGGLNVGINVDAGTIYANDRIPQLMEVYELFRDTEFHALLDRIKKRIKQYDLSLQNGEGYNALREEYNRTRETLDLFVLICHSFNHQIRFNGRGEFNMPFGRNRSAFNDTIEYNLGRFCGAMSTKHIVLSTGDFREFDYGQLERGDVVYCDPPYLITTGPYNDGKRQWDAAEDEALMTLLDELNDRGIWFAMSNVFSHRGLTNVPLTLWGAKYRVHYLNNTYINCNYHCKNRDTETVEVLLTNYGKRC